MNETRKAVIVGATGLVGGRLLADLLADPRYSQVTAITRSPLKVSHPKLHVLLTPLDRLNETPRSDLAADDAYCSLGTTIRMAGSRTAFRRVDYDFILAFAKKTKNAGASRFILVSSVGANLKSPFFYTRVKGETEEAIRKMGFGTSLIFRPSFLQGQRRKSRIGEKIGLKVFTFLQPILKGPLKGLIPTPVDRLAKVMIREAWSAPSSRVYEPWEIQ